MKNEERKKRIIFSLLIVTCYLFFGGFLHGQTADRIEWLLEQSRVSCQQAALLVLEAAGHIDPAEQARPEEAFNFAMERGWLPGKAEANNAVRLNELSLLVMRAFDINGGAFYSLFKNPHYAYRAMVYRGIVQGRTDPQMLVSGDLLLYTVNMAMSKYQ